MAELKTVGETIQADGLNALGHRYMLQRLARGKGVVLQVLDGGGNVQAGHSVANTVFIYNCISTRSILNGRKVTLQIL